MKGKCGSCKKIIVTKSNNPSYWCGAVGYHYHEAHGVPKEVTFRVARELKLL